MSEVFHIIPASLRGMGLFSGIAMGILLMVLVGVGIILLCTFHGSRYTFYEVSSEGLRIRGDLYGRLIPKSALLLEKARMVNLNEVPDLKPTRRTCGTSVPGYQAGWFRLKNGEKALLYLTNTQQAVYIPTTEGFSLLLSVEKPDRFLDALGKYCGVSMGPSRMAVKGAQS